jgi:hypothetical protein
MGLIEPLLPAIVARSEDGTLPYPSFFINGRDFSSS